MIEAAQRKWDRLTVTGKLMNWKILQVFGKELAVT
jgi:hypothetical protein